jgi:hypothetical protein
LLRIIELLGPKHIAWSKLGANLPWKGCAIASVFLLTACGPEQQTISCAPPAEAQSNSLTQTDGVKLSVLIDGTPSMQGYVNNLPNSRYAQTLKLIDSAASTGWTSANSAVKYYRFGTQKQVIDRETYLRSQLPVFYQGGADFSVSRIDTVLDKPAPDRLDVVVTDLYQKDADVQIVQNQLKDRYLEQGYGVGILAIKSEFNGTIYDVGLSGQQFSYSTVGKAPAQFHPFYVMILGSYGNIQHYYEQLQKNGLGDVEHQFLVFYPQPVRQVAVLDANAAIQKLPKAIQQPKALNDGKVVVQKKSAADPVQFFTLPRKTVAEPFETKVSYAPLPHTLPIQPSAIALTTIAERYQTRAKGFQPVQTTDGFQLRDWQVTDSTLQFKTQFQTDKLEKGIYRFSFDASPTELSEPAWWKTWTATEGSLEGAKTNNLLPFLRGLRLSTTAQMKQQKVAIARLCYGLQKN